jgi:hypothetical protein
VSGVGRLRWLLIEHGVGWVTTAMVIKTVWAVEIGTTLVCGPLKLENFLVRKS